MRKKFLPLLFSILIVIFGLVLFFPQKAYPDELEDINKQLSALTEELNKSVQATKPLESQLDGLTKQVAGIKAELSNIDADLIVKRKDIDEGYKSLTAKQEILANSVRAYYIQTYNDSPLLTLLQSASASDMTLSLAYQRAKTNQDKTIITNIALSLADLEQKEKDLKNEQERLVVVRKDLDEQSKKLDEVVSKAKNYQKEVSGKIADLSARQQSIINQRLASLNIPRSAGTSARGCSDDRSVNPGFSPRLAFFTYGAPHRNGLNQYGARGRAKAGQNEEQILSAYYPNFSLRKDYDQGTQVNVDGHGTFSIEDYVKRIYEVPDSWTDNNLAVLKAQAVAARTYALNRMQANGHICTTEACQVFKPEPKGGNWEQAVEATKGWVLMDGGGPAFSQYASTHGGYILNLGKFDGEGGNPSSFEELQARAYDKESPWFYCDWGSRSQYSNTAWLKPDEVADIVNVILLAKRDASAGEHLYQPDKPNPAGTDTWDQGRVKTELKNKGGNPYNSVSSVTVNADFGSGKTTSVNVSGDAGSQSFDAAEFKNWFNLRAPANIQIVGPLYNVERQ